MLVGNAKDNEKGNAHAEDNEDNAKAILKNAKGNFC